MVARDAPLVVLDTPLVVLDTPLVVLDTNVFVAGGFRPGSNAARVLDLLRAGDLVLAWNQPTRDETRHVLDRIPRLGWGKVAALFDRGKEVAVAPHHRAFDLIVDPADRKFAALALAAGAVLLSSDRHLLSVRAALPLPVRTPAEYMAADGKAAAAAR